MDSEGSGNEEDYKRFISFYENDSNDNYFSLAPVQKNGKSRSNLSSSNKVSKIYFLS